jgi:SRSO17 transposase
VKAVQQWVQTKDEGGLVGPRERLVVIRELGQRAQTWYTLSNARKEVPLAEAVKAHGQRHWVEELFEEGNQEVGLNHYEVRSWTGWEHQMTLSLLALRFLQVERLRLGGENAADHRGAGAGDLHGTAAAAQANRAADRGAGQRGTAA